MRIILCAFDEIFKDNNILNIIREIKKMSEDTAYLLANIFDSMINCYIECSSENDDLMAKKNEIVKRFLAMLEVGV